MTTNRETHPPGCVSRILYIEAPGMTVRGRVAGMASQATTVGEDVVHTVFAELAERPSGLRWGLSVEVEITTLVVPQAGGRCARQQRRPRYGNSHPVC
jgi:hypothetical protein